MIIIFPKNIVISIVSHGHASYIRELLPVLLSINNCDEFRLQVVLTINISEDGLEEFYSNDRIHFITNVRPRGFGDNHNQAFNLTSPDGIILLNPDIFLDACELDSFIRYFAESLDRYCLIAPVCISPEGEVEDSFRAFPSMLNLGLRYAAKVFRFSRFGNRRMGSHVDFDWVAGMFMAIPGDIYRSLNGFDTAYYMYLEDVDLCFRMQKQPLQMQRYNGMKVIHDAQRRTLKDWRHFRWHISSLAKFWVRYYSWR